MRGILRRCFYGFGAGRFVALWVGQKMILITGGAGFIGANFVVDWLSVQGESIVNLDKLTYAGNRAHLAPVAHDPRHVFVQGDIGDTALVSALLSTYQPRAVVHCAAESHVDRSIAGAEAFVQTNVVGTYRLMEAVRTYWQTLGRQTLGSEARARFRFLHVSTDEVYGSLEPGAPAFDEHHPYAPNSPYAASKAASDHLVRAWHHTYGLPVLTTHCSNNYGPYQYPEKLIPLCLRNALAGKPLPIYGDGQQVRDWLYVGDHCAAMRRVLEAGVPGQTYNVGGRSEKTNLQVVHALCAVLDEYQPRADGKSYAVQITHVADRPGHDRRYAIDATKLERTLGWKPTETFEAGLRKTVRWYLDHPEVVVQDGGGAGVTEVVV